MEIPTKGHTKTTSNGSKDDMKDDLKVHKIEIFFCFDFENLYASLLVMSKY